MIFKANWLLMPCFGVPYKRHKKISLFIQLSCLKSSVWRGGLLASSTVLRNSHVEQDNINLVFNKQNQTNASRKLQNVQVI